MQGQFLRQIEVVCLVTRVDVVKYSSFEKRIIAMKPKINQLYRQDV